MTTRLCDASHRDNPPVALSGLRLCEGHHKDLTDALTGPSVARDHTIDCLWGVRTGRTIATYTDRYEAEGAHRVACDRRAALIRAGRLSPYSPTPEIIAGDGWTWYAPRDYRPGGLTRDWSALELRDRTFRTGEPVPYATGSSEAVLPIDDAVAELRSQIQHDLTWWIGEHVRAQKTVYPVVRSPHQQVAWLARCIDWSAAQPWAGEYVGTLVELRARARRLIDLPLPRRMRIAPCPESVGGQQCAGSLFSVPREERDPRPVSVACDECGATFEGPQFLRLCQRLTQGVDLASRLAS